MWQASALAVLWLLSSTQAYGHKKKTQPKKSNHQPTNKKLQKKQNQSKAKRTEKPKKPNDQILVLDGTAVGLWNSLWSTAVHGNMDGVKY